MIKPRNWLIKSIGLVFFLIIKTYKIDKQLCLPLEQNYKLNWTRILI